MTAGVMIKGVGGGVQVNEQIVAWGMSGTGSVTLVDDGMTHPQPMVRGVITVSGGFPVVAIRPRGGMAVGIDYTAGSGGSYTYHLMAQSHGAVVVDYWVFDNASQAFKDPTLNDVGVKAWDESGVLTFDAAMPHMRLVGAMTPGMPDTPIGSDQSTSATFAVPATKSYAVVIGTIGHIATMYDTGNYTTGSPSIPPDVEPTVPEDPDAGPPPGATWREQILETYLGMVSFDGGVFEVGMMRFENWRGWYPIGQTPHLIKSGSPTFTVVDVTGYGGGGGSGGPTITVNLNAYSVSVSGAAGATTISPPVTATPSGGTGPYALRWAYESGSTAIVNYDATDANPFRTQSPTQPGGTVRVAKWRVKATDSLGNSGWSEPVTFTHTATSGPDYIPDPPSFGDITINSNDPDVGWIGTTSVISGINQTITLRVERYSYSGNLTEAYIDVIVRDTGGTIVFQTYFGVTGTAQAYADFTVQNGYTVEYYAHGVTTSGMRAATWVVSVWNLSNPGGPVKISDKNVSVTVDNDNNYNPAPDYTPNAFSLGTMALYTNDYWGYSTTQVAQITGINQTVSLKFTRDSLSISGNIIYGRTYVGHASSPSGPWTDYLLTAAAGDSVTFNVTNGMYIRAYAYAETSSGYASVTWNCYVQNMSVGGAYINTFYGDCYVDVDNNYNVTPVDPIVVSVSNPYSYIHDFTMPGQFYYIGDNPGVTFTGGQAPFSYNWALSSGFNLTGDKSALSPTFSLYRMTNWNTLTVMRLTITDALGNKGYADFTADWAAGDTFS